MKVKEQIDKELEELVPAFISNRKKDLEILKKAEADADFEALAAQGHKIKGSSSGYGFVRLSQLAEQLEFAAKTKNIKTCHELIEKMESYLANVEIQYT